jgi:hypothetical protein
MIDRPLADGRVGREGSNSGEEKGPSSIVSLTLDPVVEPPCAVADSSCLPLDGVRIVEVRDLPAISVLLLWRDDDWVLLHL